MVNHGKVQSTVKPDSVVVDSQSVWISENIEAVKTEEFEGFSYDLTQYTLEEYTLKSIEVNQELERQVSETQMAIVEIYESLVV